MIMLDVLVIGAGMSGLIAATELHKSNYKVACVEKARGSGGRLSSKRLQLNHSEDMVGFDLGCAGFDAKTELFRSHIEKWSSLGLAQTWHYSEGKGTQYVGVPRNSSITRYLADQLDVHFATRISGIDKDGEFWRVSVGEGDAKKEFARTKHIVFATPPQQAADLLPEQHEFKELLSRDILLPQWVLMLNIKGTLGLADSYLETKDSIISRLVLDQAKPERTANKGYQLWMVHANTDWTLANLETAKEELINSLVSELASISGSPVIIEDAYLHRWLYSEAQNNELTGKKFLSDDKGLWFCGDYLADTKSLNGLEAAFHSGYQLSKNFRQQQI